MYSLFHWILAIPEHHIGLLTLLAAFVAVYLYLKQKGDNKRDAALLILQEIRYAEERIRNYKAYTAYSYAENLLPTNNWNKNINLFVANLKEREIDLISKFYSSAMYLDDVLKFVSRDATEVNVRPPPTNQGPPPQGAAGIQTTGLHQLAQNYIKTISESIEYVSGTQAFATLEKLSEQKWYRLGL